MTFEVADLLRITARPEAYDLVLCRNTVIYFTDDVRDALHAQARASPCARAATSWSGRPSVSPNTSALGLVPAFPFTYRKSGLIRMDTSEYLPMFLAECREHLQELNLAVVRLEESPEDRETLDEIFRAAHSLKGMSATMGFDGIARLTHQMEDVFELLRQRTSGHPGRRRRRRPGVPGRPRRRDRHHRRVRPGAPCRADRARSAHRAPQGARPR